MADGLFPGPLSPMPAASTGVIMIPSAPPPRFIDGIDVFAAFAQRADAEPAVLAADLAALWTFIAEHPEILADAALAESAARFFGNAIAVRHPAATWRATPAAEVGTSTRSVPVADLVRMIVEHPERLDPFLEMFADWAQDDEDDAEWQALTRGLTGPPLVIAPTPYRRPPLPVQEFRDDEGRLIEYGHRWGNGGPPEEAYSRVTHPERFAPLLLVVDALVDHLAANHVVDIEHEELSDGSRRIRLQPTTGAPITLTTTAESVQIEAGALFREWAPDCTCDACDDAVESAAGHLEQTVLSIAGGGLRERYPVGRRRWVLTEVRAADGTGRSGGGPPDPELALGRLEEVEELLRDLDDGRWPAWELRTS